MGSTIISQYKKKITRENKSKGDLNIIKSDYILQNVFDYLPKKKSLKIIKYNKNLQNRLKININDYKNYSSIELEIKPLEKKYDILNNFYKKNSEYIHIYFYDDNEKEINKNSMNYKLKVSKIKMILDYQINSLEDLFKNCESIQSISFKKFCRNNITNMSNMFYECSSLKELDISNFNTNKVTNMSGMFYGCSSLKELDI